MNTALSAPSPALSRRIRRLSLIVRFMAFAGMALGTFAVFLVWANPDLVRAIIVPQVGLHDHPVTLTTGAQVSGFAITLIPLAVFIYTLHLVARLFGAFAKGFVFDTDNARVLKYLGGTLITLAVVAILARTGIALALTMGNQPGLRIISIGLDSGHYGALLGGGAIMAFAMVFEEAVRLADENKGFV